MKFSIPKPLIEFTINLNEMDVKSQQKSYFFLGYVRPHETLYLSRNDSLKKGIDRLANSFKTQTHDLTQDDILVPFYYQVQSFCGNKIQTKTIFVNLDKCYGDKHNLFKRNIFAVYKCDLPRDSIVIPCIKTKKLKHLIEFTDSKLLLDNEAFMEFEAKYPVIQIIRTSDYIDGEVEFQQMFEKLNGYWYQFNDDQKISFHIDPKCQSYSAFIMKSLDYKSYIANIHSEWHKCEAFRYFPKIETPSFLDNIYKHIKLNIHDYKALHTTIKDLILLKCFRCSDISMLKSLKSIDAVWHFLTFSYYLVELNRFIRMSFKDFIEFNETSTEFAEYVAEISKDETKSLKIWLITKGFLSKL